MVYYNVREVIPLCNNCQKIKDGMKNSLLDLSSETTALVSRVCRVCGTEIILQKKEGKVFQKTGGGMIEAN